jgi:regulator of protease activity HflC (stomatin/prohibitin superfamily)
MDETKTKAGLIGFGVVVVLGLLMIFSTFGTIDAGERGVHTRFSNVVGIKDPGLYFKLPFIDKIRTFNVKTQVVSYEREEPLEAASKDLQAIQIATVVNYHLDPSAVGQIYTQYGREDVFETNVIRPTVRDTVKAVASQYTTEELVTKRPEFTEAVRVKLNERLVDNHVIVEQVNITNFAFSPSFQAAIDAKSTAEQNALAAKNKLAQSEYEAAQRVAQAKGEAEAIRIQSQAINAQGGEDYVNLKAIEKWNGMLPQQFVPGSALPFINLPR